MYFMQKYLLGIDDETKCLNNFLTLFEACQNQYNMIKHTNVDMN